MSSAPYGYPVLPAAGQYAVQPYRCSTAHVVIAWVLTALSGLYLLPWAVAATRNRRNVASIALLNVFLGWTLIGWVVALIWACGSDQPVLLVQHVQHVQQAQHGYAPQPVWGPPYQWPSTPPAPYAGPAAPPAPAVQTHRPPSTPPALPPAAPPPTARHRDPEPTRVDLFGNEPTQQLPRSPWERPDLYDPPAYGPGAPDRR